MELPAPKRRPPFGSLARGHGVRPRGATPSMALSSRAAMPLAEPFEGCDNPGDRNSKTGQTPDGVGHSKISYCQYPGGNACNKGEYPPKHNESPGAFVASHSRLQNPNIPSQGLYCLFTPTLTARKLPSPTPSRSTQFCGTYGSLARGVVVC